MTQISTVRDELETTAAGMADAMLHRMAPASQLTDNGQRFRNMTLLEMARELLGAQGVNVRGMERMALAAQVMNFRSMGTADFPSILRDVGNKRMRLAYEQNPSTYKAWARQAESAPDFKAINVFQMSGAPDLLQTNEHGEFKYGTMKDAGESYALITHGRIVSLTRQAIVNDDTRAFSAALQGFGNSAARLENRLVYSQLTANAPLSDGIPLFHEDRKNVDTGSLSGLKLSSLALMRSRMRLQRGLQAEELNLAPRYLIVPTALEQDAYQLTSANYVPARSADVNEFRSGGRTSLEPIVEPLLDGVSSTAWYAAASSGIVDTVEYCYLAGAEGPVLETYTDFTTDALSVKCRLDFAAKAIDYRGLYRSAGA